MSTDAVQSARAERTRKRKRESDDQDSSRSKRGATAVFVTAKSMLKPKETSVATSGGKLDGPIITIRAGESQWSAHASVLALSPVFHRMCSGPFLESKTKVIELPEDDPEALGMFLECLYAYRTLFPDSHVLHPGLFRQSPEKLSEKAVELYILADKYQVPELQIAAVNALKLDTFYTGYPKRFFRVAERIYSNVGSEDGPYQKHFKSEVRQALEFLDANPCNPDQTDHVSRLIRGGDVVAVHIFQALRGFWSSARRELQSEKAKTLLLEAELKRLQEEHQQSDTALKEAEEELAEAQDSLKCEEEECEEIKKKYEILREALCQVGLARLGPEDAGVRTIA